MPLDLSRFSTHFARFFILAGVLSPVAAHAEPLTKNPGIELKIEESWTVPLLEISGIGRHEASLYLASDNSRNILRVPFKVDAGQGLNLLKTDELTLAHVTEESPQAPVAENDSKKEKKKKKKKEKNKKSQWEALAIDKAGSIFAVKESDDQIFMFNPSGAFKRNYQLAAFDRRSHKSKGYEGLLLLKKSHILVALSNAPILVEFGPKGDQPLGVTPESILPKDLSFTESADSTLYPLASWELDAPGPCELSDLAVDSEGRAFALLKTCARIIPIPPLDPKTKSFAAAMSWSFPMELEHAEGLLNASPRGFLVAIDFKEERKNLYWLSPKSEALKR